MTIRNDCAIERMQDEIDYVSNLCDMLELIADTLPNSPTPPFLEKVATDLQKHLPYLHSYEENVLLPLLSKRAMMDDRIQKVATVLKNERLMDGGYILEVVALLNTMSQDKKLKNPEAAGYLLRSFFESLRRHLHWVSVIISS